jgi:TPR repeat protein
MYASGRGLEKSHAKGARWLKLAAEQGHAAAQGDLGHIYTGGLGVEQSFEEAARWLKKAADQGQAEAQYHLAALYQKGLGVDNERQGLGEVVEKGSRTRAR